jgi:RHS repeat-associated protein
VRPDGKEITFTYDGLGRRISKKFNGLITRWVWDGDRPLHEWSYPEKEKPQQVVNEWGGVSYNKQEPNPANEQGAMNSITWIFEPDSHRLAAKMVNGASYSVITDHLGTPQWMYDAGGKKVWEGVLDIYGRVRNLHGTNNDLPFRYQGQYEDVETGLYYNRFRYYNPDEGMYISQDPIGLHSGQPNLYAYVNDPNTWVDVLGLKCGDRNVKTRIEDGNLKEGWIHIDARHVTGNHPNGPGDLFAAGTTRRQLEKAAAKIVKKGTRVTEDITKRMQTFEKKMVVNGKQDLVRVTVDSQDANRVITIFPVRGGGHV